MIRTGGTGREKLPKEPNLERSPKNGNARYAVPGRNASGRWADPVQRPQKAADLVTTRAEPQPGHCLFQAVSTRPLKTGPLKIKSAGKHQYDNDVDGYQHIKNVLGNTNVVTL